jgi:hypothetical protein
MKQRNEKPDLPTDLKNLKKENFFVDFPLFSVIFSVHYSPKYFLQAEESSKRMRSRTLDVPVRLFYTFVSVPLISLCSTCQREKV